MAVKLSAAWSSTASWSPSFDRKWPKDLPSGVIHADLFPDNVFFLGEKLSGLIDFYFACNDFYAYDVATCLNAWCFEKDFSFNLTKGMATDWARHGLNVNGIAPGYIRTELNEALIKDPEFNAWVEKRTPMGAFAERTAEKYGFTREQQDAFAIASLERAFGRMIQ